jgi:hypothetical protein
MEDIAVVKCEILAMGITVVEDQALQVGFNENS